MGRPEWFNKKAGAINKANGPAPATFIESNLKDLKGRPITDRVYKDDWGGASDTFQKSLDTIMANLRNEPGLSDEMIANDQKNGFYPAGTTTNVDPSRNAKHRRGDVFKRGR